MTTREKIEQAITNFVKGRVNIANSYVSYNSLVLDTDNQWKIINNLAVVDAR